MVPRQTKGKTLFTVRCGVYPKQHLHIEVLPHITRGAVSSWRDAQRRSLDGLIPLQLATTVV